MKFNKIFKKILLIALLFQDLSALKMKVTTPQKPTLVKSAKQKLFKNKKKSLKKRHRIRPFANNHNNVKSTNKHALLRLGKVERIKTALRSHYTGFSGCFGNLGTLKKWGTNSQWHYFHGNVKHVGYDWWVFPTGDVGRSNPEGPNAYSVSQKEIDALKSDPTFMNDYREAVRLQLLSWGWDAKNKKPVTSPQKDQVYDYYEIRLQKMANSLILFGEKELHESVNAFYRHHYTAKNKKPGAALKKYCTHRWTKAKTTTVHARKPQRHLSQAAKA